MTDYLSALISGLSALLGAGIGGFATYRAASRGSLLAAQTEQRVWMRERRENAYVAFLTARNRYVDAYIAKGDAMQEWSRRAEQYLRADPFDFQPDRQRTSEALAELEREFANVELFGSVAAREAARAWMPQLRSDYAVATRPGGAFGAGLRELQAQEVKSRRDPFIALIRNELGIDH